MSPVAAHDLLQLPTERASAGEGGYLWNLEYLLEYGKSRAGTQFHCYFIGLTYDHLL